MNPYTQGPYPGFHPYRYDAPNIGAAPLRAPMNPMSAPNVGRPVTPQPIYPFATAQQNQYAGGQNPSFVAQNQYYYNNQAPFVRPYFIDPQNIFQIPTGTQFAPGTRVGYIQFFEPTGHAWFSNANDFEIVSNSLINSNENETLMLQRRRELPQGNMPFRHNFMADNPPVALNPTVHLNQPLQNDSMHASYAQAGQSNLSASETLSPSYDRQIDEPMVANNEVVVTSTNSAKTDQVISQITLPLGFCGQVQPMEADVPFKLQMQSKLSDFCWTCHKLVAEEDKVNRSCNCGLVFHEKCQPDTVLPTVSGLLPNGEDTEITLDRTQMIGKCKECVQKEVGALYNREFGMNENEAKIVFIYAATKLADDKELDCFKKLHTIGTDKLMDLDTIMVNAQQNGYYPSIERFMFDIKLIIHHARIINENRNGTFTEENLTKLLKSAKVEMNYISMCPDCYRNYYECTLEQTIDNADDIPCLNPHGIVWAKKDKHWLPAKVYEYRVADHFYTSKDLVSVFFFGVDQNEPIQVNASECFMYSNKYPGKRTGLKKPALKNLRKSKRVLKQYVKNLGLFFTHKYQVPEDETGFEWDKIFIDINIQEPKDREEALKNITKRELPTRH